MSDTPPAAPTGTYPGGGGVLTARLAGMMFLQFFVWGSWYVSTARFLGEYGVQWFDTIPWAYSVAPIAALISPLFLGIVADRYFASERVLAGLMLAGAAAMAAVPLLVDPGDPSAGNRWLYVGLLLAHTLCFMPTLGLTASLSFSHLPDPERQFPTVRVLGTVGWIAANLAVGFWEAVFGTGGLGGENLELSVDQYWVTAAASLALGVYALTLPHTPPPLKGEPARPADLLGLGAVSMMRDRSFAVFILASAFLCVPLAGYYNYSNEFVGGTGFEQNATAVMSAGQASEILFMLLMPLAFARLGVKWMLAAGMLGWVVRYVLFSGGATAFDAAGADGTAATALLTPSGLMVLGGIVLHGICYDFFFVTGQIYTEKRAPAALRGQAQGFLVLMTQGVGLLVGAQLFGRLVAAYTSKVVGPDGGPVLRPDGKALTEVDWTTIWMYPAGAAAVILAAFCVLFRDRLPAADRADLAGRESAGAPPAPDPGTGGVPAA